jgi:hypothetical protein
LTGPSVTPPNRGLHGFYKESVIRKAATFQGGDSIQHGLLRSFSTAGEQKGCAESFVKRFRCFALGCHC